MNACLPLEVGLSLPVTRAAVKAGSRMMGAYCRGGEGESPRAASASSALGARAGAQSL